MTYILDLLTKCCYKSTQVTQVLGELPRSVQVDVFSTEPYLLLLYRIPVEDIQSRHATSAEETTSRIAHR